MPSEPIFVKVRNDEGEIYPSYDIIYQLIEWNFPTCELDDVTPESKNTYIFPVDNGNVKACCERPHRARYIVWNLEIPGQVPAACPDYMDEIWVSDSYFYDLVPDKKKFVILGGDTRLAKDETEEWGPTKTWDFCHIAYIYGRRAEIVASLVDRGYTMAPIGFGRERDYSISHSRWGLCLHQNDVPALSPQRMTLFACRSLPIVLESGNPFPYEVTMLKDFTKTISLRQIENNYNFFVYEHTFKQCVLEALHA